MYGLKEWVSLLADKCYIVWRTKYIILSLVFGLLGHYYNPYFVLKPVDKMRFVDDSRMKQYTH